MGVRIFRIRPPFVTGVCGCLKAAWIWDVSTGP